MSINANSMKHIYFLLIALCFYSSAFFGQADSAESVNNKFELSFGQSILFIPDEKLEGIAQKESIIIPTNSILFFAEFRPQKKLRIPLYVNLPTESKQFFIDSVLVNEKANATGGFGLQYKCIQVPISKASVAEWEMGALSNLLISKRNRFRIVPLLNGRIRLVKNNNFVMYLGTSYSFGVNSWGLFYGTGFLF